MMNKLIVITISSVLGSLLVVSTVFAESNVKNRLPTDYEVKAPASTMQPTVIDTVPVPYEVLVYAQVVYQGYAVTQAQETTWNGQKAYQLRIDNDSNPNDANGMYLLYDINWKLIDDKPLYAPLPKERKIGVDRVEKKPTDLDAQGDSDQQIEDERNNISNEEQENDTDSSYDTDTHSMSPGADSDQEDNDDLSSNGESDGLDQPIKQPEEETDSEEPQENEEEDNSNEDDAQVNIRQDATSDVNKPNAN